MSFNAMHEVILRTPYDIKKWGQPDKPYHVAWDYPVMRNGQCLDVRRRYKTVTADKAFEFALKHDVPLDRMPRALARRVKDYVRTIEEIAQ